MTPIMFAGMACVYRLFGTLRRRYLSRSSQQIMRKSWRRNDAATISPYGSRRVLRDAIAARRLRSVKRSVRSTIKPGGVPVLPPFGETNRDRNRTVIETEPAARSATSTRAVIPWFPARESGRSSQRTSPPISAWTGRPRSRPAKSFLRRPSSRTPSRR